MGVLVRVQDGADGNALGQVSVAPLGDDPQQDF